MYITIIIVIYQRKRNKEKKGIVCSQLQGFRHGQKFVHHEIICGRVLECGRGRRSSDGQERRRNAVLLSSSSGSSHHAHVLFLEKPRVVYDGRWLCLIWTRVVRSMRKLMKEWPVSGRGRQSLLLLLVQ